MIKLIEEPKLICLLAAPRCAGLYREEGLDEQDKKRVIQTPSLTRRADWRVSRYLKQQAVLPVLSLSHSHGSAAVLTGYGVERAGVDIEYMRLRDFPALAEWVASPQEREYLAQRGWQREDFYELWTLKESLLKAENLNFPSDMQKVGYAFASDGQRYLHAKQEGGWQGRVLRLEKHMLACVWQGTAEFSVNAQPDMHINDYGSPF
ncbi:4'-phosphopantetheinyl transferase family protein [Neisseria dumasiana]|uniref:4'-phosphopantetheinyl transferase family protein n=1 Tax=Neisseria dumasiana TaxID=1931275 RepID=UPI000A18F284|nr:4'-phosphopantetheinyl transferase superfamily protein [Neisseria dumasiana]UOO83608.1 4'-phosphopantetheinyl transferase superfamily protein [Neisseria dumasiana]